MGLLGRKEIQSKEEITSATSSQVVSHDVTPLPKPLKKSSSPPSNSLQNSRIQELNSVQRDKLIEMNWKLISGENSENIVTISKKQTTFVAVLRFEQGNNDESGPRNILVVAKDFRTDPEVSSARNTIKRVGLTIHKEYLVDLNTVQSIYKKGNVFEIVRNRQDSDAPTTAFMQKTFAALLEAAVSYGASDIHIDSVENAAANVRFRIDGVITKIRELETPVALELCAAVYNMADNVEATYSKMHYQAARLTNGSVAKKNLTLPAGVQAVRLQFNPLGTSGRYLVARILYFQQVDENADIDELGYLPNQLVDIRKMRRKVNGINLISGPTGSGKSTTLQRSMIATLRERFGINLITIEDPPEYIIKGAIQLPVLSQKTEERNKGFTEALRASLRDDPDVIMIGEIRDLDIAHLAYTAAETGHGVWASLHANSAIATLDRLRFMGFELYKLTDASKITGLVAQRLVRKIKPSEACSFAEAKANKLVPEETFNFLEQHLGEHVSKLRFGATHRHIKPDDAFKGRTVAAETVLVDQVYLDYYRDGKKREAIQHWKENLKGMEMIEHAFVLLMRGIIDVRSLEDAMGPIEDIDVTRIPKLIEIAGQV